LKLRLNKAQLSDGTHRVEFVDQLHYDGRRIVGISNRTVCFWDAATGKEIKRIATGHHAAITNLALSNDGKTLATGSADTTALIFDIGDIKPQPPQPVELDRAQAQALWTTLAGDDAEKAYEAVRSLSSAPAQSLPLVREHLKPVTPPMDPQKIGKLIADLDDKNFAVRDRATTELQALGELAEPALRKALAGKPSLELRKRIEQLLDAERLRNTAPPTGEERRALRGLEVLEHIGTPEAVHILKKVADGADGARLTREAKASLARLDR
jgi:hypothetical protein